MAKKGGGRRRQGIVSWATSLIALFIALFRPLTLLMQGNTNAIVYEASAGLAGSGGGKFDRDAALRMYGPMLGAIIFKAVSGELAKRVHLRGIVPALRA